ncbi:MAG TPA: hypothetical protein VMU64_14245 [Acidimicrobiales bacterium]|nr:hypothetical protein [Acidimicrobiales bacterium]
MSEALDAVSDRCRQHPDFEGLVCLQHDSVLHQIIVITLWGGQGLEDTQADSELTQQQIATTTDLGVSNICYEVVRLIPGSVVHDGFSLTPALAS